MGRLDGKVCFVTGAGSGIGAKTAELFAHEGASVIMADMHEENLSKVAADIQAAGGEVMTAVVNITDNDAVKAAFAAGVEKYGKIDALANIAGVLDVAMRPIDDFLTSDLDTTLTVHVKGTMYVTRAAVKQFIAQGYGTIATVASVGGVNGNGSAAYTVSKGAEVALTKHIALRFANGEQKIRANCVCPGTVMTPMTTRAMKARGKYTKAAKAMQAVFDRLGFPPVSDEEVEAEYQSLADTYQMELEKVKALAGADSLRQDLLVRKAAKLVAEAAVPVAPKAEEEPKTEE